MVQYPILERNRAAWMIACSFSGICFTHRSAIPLMGWILNETPKTSKDGCRAKGI